MELRQSTPPALEPISVSELRDQARKFETDEDSLLESFIVAARQSVELSIERALITQTFELELNGFPNCNTLKLPRPNLQSVTSIAYTDANGDAQTLDSSIYTISKAKTNPSLVLNSGESWPSTYDQVATVLATYVAGYGDDAADVPEMLRLAIGVLATHYFENRTLGAMPSGLEYLIAPYRVYA